MSRSGPLMLLLIMSEIFRPAGSIIYGRSVHNQRIERLWRDVFNGVTRTFYTLFYQLEDDNKLNPNNPLHLFCLHFVFLTRINDALSAWRTAWSMHRLRTTGMTPQQMFVLSTNDNRMPNVSSKILYYEK